MARTPTFIRKPITTEDVIKRLAVDFPVMELQTREKLASDYVGIIREINEKAGTKKLDVTQVHLAILDEMIHTVTHLEGIRFIR